jgi:hypothetical protein
MASQVTPETPAVRQVVDEIGSVLDRLFSAPEQRAKAELARHEIARLPALKEIDLAGQASLFVAGWRPMIGWICALALAWAFILQPVAVWAVATFALGAAVPTIATDHLLEMVLAMLGIAGLRTFEKTQAR